MIVLYTTLIVWAMMVVRNREAAEPSSQVVMAPSLSRSGIPYERPCANRPQIDSPGLLEYTPGAANDMYPQEETTR